MAGVTGRSSLLCLALLTACIAADWAFVQPPLPKLEQRVPKRANLARAPDAAAGPSLDEAASSTWRVALAACAALLVALVPLQGAEAARSGGRMGGMGMRGMPPPQRQQQQQQAPSGPRFAGGPSVSIGVGPVIAPPMFGYSPFGSPFGLFGPPMLPVPVPSMGPSYSDRMLQDQQRRDERQLDGQKQQIDALQKELAELRAKKQ